MYRLKKFFVISMIFVMPAQSMWWDPQEPAKQVSIPTQPVILVQKVAPQQQAIAQLMAAHPNGISPLVPLAGALAGIYPGYWLGKKAVEDDNLMPALLACGVGAVVVPLSVIKGANGLGFTLAAATSAALTFALTYAIKSGVLKSNVKHKTVRNELPATFGNETLKICGTSDTSDYLIGCYERPESLSSNKVIRSLYLFSTKDSTKHSAVVIDQTRITDANQIIKVVVRQDGTSNIAEIVYRNKAGKDCSIMHSISDNRRHGTLELGYPKYLS